MNRWERLANAIVPWLESEEQLNDPVLFARYDEASESLARATDPDVVVELEQASKDMFDAETVRRDSIDTRISTLLGASGILGALVVGAGQIVLGTQHPSLSRTGEVAVGFYMATLLYIGATIVRCLSAHGHPRGAVVGPDDLPPVDAASVASYQAKRARLLSKYASLNYQVDNRVMSKLTSALACLRNGIICLLVVGVLSLWSVRPASSASPGPTGPPNPATYVGPHLHAPNGRH